MTRGTIEKVVLSYAFAAVLVGASYLTAGGMRIGGPHWLAWSVVAALVIGTAGAALVLFVKRPERPTE